MRDSDSRETQAQVCQRCLMRLETNDGGVDLPRRIRATLAEHGCAERVRVKLTGCLGYCPRGQVSVQLLRDGEVSGVVVIDPARDGAELMPHLPCPSTEAS
jgi:predicted metal-binding protein